MSGGSPTRPLPVAPLVDREDALQQAAETALDVLVIGGGITGVGIALDAAARGLDVALVERDDLASGTSSKSSKLVHGGLRYLEQYEFGLVYEGVRERNLLRRLAPHLVRPLGFAIPTADLTKKAAVKAGLSIYDAMATGRNVRAHRHLNTDELLDAVPGLVNGIGRGGYGYYDCQTDDARLTFQVAQIARHLGALVVTHAEVVDLLRFGDRVVGAAVRDQLDGGSVELTARWTVSATGVWADDVRRLTKQHDRGLLTPSKGVHIAFSADDVHVRDAALVPSGAGDGRLVFVIPWGEQVIVGTTDDHYEGRLDRPIVTGRDLGYLLRSVNHSFGTRLGSADVIGAWAGLRPLLAGSDETRASRDLSRRHAIFEGPPGLVSITGGKLTTFRQMAEDVVDRIVATDGDRRRSPTRNLPLGLRGRAEDHLASLRRVCDIVGIDRALAGSLLHRHGADAPAVAAFCAEHGETEPLFERLPYVEGEVRWAARHELVRTLDDLLQRRMRVSLRHPTAGGSAVTRAADILAEEFGWDREEKDRQIATYLDGVRAERGAVALDDAWWSQRRDTRGTGHSVSA